MLVWICGKIKVTFNSIIQNEREGKLEHDRDRLQQPASGDHQTSARRQKHLAQQHPAFHVTALAHQPACMQQSYCNVSITLWQLSLGQERHCTCGPEKIS